jgi:hypothetical protein
MEAKPRVEVEDFLGISIAAAIISSLELSIAQRQTFGRDEGFNRNSPVTAWPAAVASANQAEDGDALSHARKADGRQLMTYARKHNFLIERMSQERTVAQWGDVIELRACFFNQSRGYFPAFSTIRRPGTFDWRRNWAIFGARCSNSAASDCFGLASAPGTIVDRLCLSKSRLGLIDGLDSMRQIVLGILVFFGLVVAIALFLGARSPRSDVISSEMHEIDANTPSRTPAWTSASRLE